LISLMIRTAMIVNRIYQWAQAQPDNTALIHNGSTLSYGAFARMIDARRQFFASRNLPRRRTAVVLIQDLAEAWAAVLGLRAAGLNTICVASMHHAEGLDIGDVCCVVRLKTETIDLGQSQAFPQAATFDLPAAFDNALQPQMLPEPLTAPAGGHILYTSGTTGFYKKVLCAAQHELERLSLIARSRGNTADTVNHAQNFGLWTTIGYTQTLSVWLVGGTVVTDQRPTALETFFDHGVNKAIVLPPVLRSLVDLHGSDSPTHSRCAISVSGGFSPRQVIERTSQRLTRDISVAYGSTECGSIARSRYLSADDHIWLAPALERTIEIADEFEQPLGYGLEGALRVRLLAGDAHAYLDDEDATARHFRGGYFYPGDMAVRRADGRVRILGRVDDVLNIQGQKVAVAPLEQRLQSFLHIENVCLFSGMGGDGREELVIALETNRALTPVEQEQITLNYRMFGRIRIVTLNTFPRTDAGMQKIRRAELRKMILG
jgi:acyl-coenzyme A synthetase/AMP-(fatty) acid ligase